MSSRPLKSKNHWDPVKWDAMDAQIEQIICEFDDSCMPVPDIEFEPHVLISKVRKHYMEYIIRLLSHNYETNQQLLNKNIYLPSAIWRCAKIIETKAAQMCMVVQLYRNHITSVINEVKTDTKMGKLNKRLYECLHKAPLNEKKVQTVKESSTTCCTCDINVSKRKRKSSSPNKTFSNTSEINQARIPVVINMQINQEPIKNIKPIPPKPQTPTNTQLPNNSDDLMMQLEKLFHSDPKEDDLFEDSLYNTMDPLTEESNKRTNDVSLMLEDINTNSNKQDSIVEEHSEKIKSLNQRIETLAGILENHEAGIQQHVLNKKKQVKRYTSKWHCEEYFTKKDLYELLYQIGDTNRNKLSRIKQKYIMLFGEDSDDEEGIISPITESVEFIESCKARITSWVITTLNPFYARGRIRGKALYKSVAKHLIDIIYKCKQYPSKYEVTTFVLDFLETHDMIRCEADFKEFKIENVPNYNLL